MRHRFNPLVRASRSLARRVEREGGLLTGMPSFASEEVEISAVSAPEMNERHPIGRRRAYCSGNIGVRATSGHAHPNY